MRSASASTRTRTPRRTLRFDLEPQPRGAPRPWRTHASGLIGNHGRLGAGGASRRSLSLPALRSPVPDVWWIRDDLRLADNPAFVAAAERGSPLAVCVWDAEAMGARARGRVPRLAGLLLGGALRVIAARGGWLVLARVGQKRSCRSWRRATRSTPPVVLSPGCTQCTQARRMVETVGEDRLSLHTAALLHEPHRLQGLSSGAVGTFAAFRRRLANPVLSEPLPPPSRFTDASSSDRLEDWPLLPPACEDGWERGLARGWTPGKAGVQARLAGLGAALASYAQEHDRLDGSGRSGLSPHLRWGEIAPWAAWRPSASPWLSQTSRPALRPGACVPRPARRAHRPCVGMGARARERAMESCARFAAAAADCPVQHRHRC